MPVMFQWAAETPNVLICESRQVWTWDEVYSATKIIDPAYAEGVFDVIVDLRQSEGIPSGALAQLMHARQQNLHHRGGVVVVSNSCVVATLAKLALQLLPRLAFVQVVSTMQEAWQHLETIRANRLKLVPQ